MIGIFLEKACKVQLAIAASGLPWSAPDAEVEALRRGQILSPIHIEQSWGYFCRKLDWRTGAAGGSSAPLFSV